MEESLQLADRWILSRFHHVTQQTRQAIEQFGLGEAAKGLYEFIWGDFCDWYIELVKSRLQGEDADARRTAQQVLAFVLEGTLRLLHPFMPHITEELWHTLTQAGDEQSLALQSYPTVNPTRLNSDLEQQFALLIGVIRTIRNLRAEAEIKPGMKIQVILQSDRDRERSVLAIGQTYIQDLAKVAELTIGDNSQTDSETRQLFAGVVGTVQVLIPLAGVVDVALLRTKLEKNLKKVESEMQSLANRLSNPNFVNKAASDVVAGARKALAEAEKQTAILRDRLSRL